MDNHGSYAVDRFVQKKKVAIMACFLPDFPKIHGDSRQNLCRISPRTYEIRVRSPIVADG